VVQLQDLSGLFPQRREKMKTLLILRHAKSSWSNASLADHARPLNERGRHDAPRMGRLLRQEDLLPQLIISSTATRALATAEAVAMAGGYEGEIQTTRRLYHAGPESYLAVLRGVADDYDQVMVVGHNPGVEELVDHLTGQAETMSTAALAHIQLPIEQWQELNKEVEGKLVGLWRPRELS
jgi:phosphohistidine phosphatase